MQVLYPELWGKILIPCPLRAFTMYGTGTCLDTVYNCQGGEKPSGSSGQKEALPSPASDATTSTRSTPSTTTPATHTPALKLPSNKGRPPGSLNKLKKPPIMPRLLPRPDQLDK